MSVPSASAVLVVVIDCTVTGAPSPTGTEPTLIRRVGRRSVVVQAVRPMVLMLPAPVRRPSAHGGQPADLRSVALGGAKGHGQAGGRPKDHPPDVGIAVTWIEGHVP